MMQMQIKFLGIPSEQTVSKTEFHILKAVMTVTKPLSVRELMKATRYPLAVVVTAAKQLAAKNILQIIS